MTKMVAKALLLIGLIALTPLAAATELVTVGNKNVDGAQADQYTGHGVFGTITYRNKVNETYVFTGPNPPFNYTAALGTNESFSAWQLRVRHLPVLDVSNTIHFDWAFTYNTSERIDISADYVKSGWGWFAGWDATYTFEHNGVFICNSVVSPTPFSGDYSTDIPLDLSTSDIQVSPAAQITAENGSLRWTVFDAYFGSTSVYSCNNPATGFSGINFTAVTGPISVQTYATDNTPHNHAFVYAFMNTANFTQRASDWSSNATMGTTEEPCGANFLDFMVHCFFGIAGQILGSVVKTAFEFVYGLLDYGLTIILALIPGGLEVKRILLYPATFTFDLITTLFAIFFNSGPGYGPGGVYFSLIIWVSCMGACIGGAIGKMEYVYTLPYYFVKMTTIGLFILLYWLYWEIPKYIISWIVSLFGEASPG